MAERASTRPAAGVEKTLAAAVAALGGAERDGPVVAATATLVLQAQIVDRDLPRLIEAVDPVLGRKSKDAILKSPDGVVERVIDDSTMQTVEEIDRDGVDVSAHWEAVPVFEGWSGLGRRDRDADTHESRERSGGVDTAREGPGSPSSPLLRRA